MGESADPRLVESWEVEDVSAWITEIGFPQYKGTFEGNFISGWKLVNQFTSNAQLISMNIKDHDDHKAILVQIKELRLACGLDSVYSVPPALLNNAQLLSPEEAELARDLCLTAGQVHLFDGWPALGIDDDEKLRLMAQLIELDSQYPGGLLQYAANAVDLLAASAAGENPLEGFKPSVPEGVPLEFSTEGFGAAEETGIRAVASTAFVLVAGGLGERLGYGGIKVALPSEITTGKCYLALYIEYMLALQTRACEVTGDKSVMLPLAIMTSDDTHSATAALLEENGYFGMAPGQVTLMKQNKVPAVLNNDGAFALDPADAYSVLTKPHGHGDVHSLLLYTGVLDTWVAQGRKWLYFFQDTNAHCFRTFLPSLGVSVLHDYDFSSICIPRQPKQAVGAICRLAHEDGRVVTLNVEYNQLDPMLRAVDGSGDVAAEGGLSPYPGNTNQLIIKMSSYTDAMGQSGGQMPEFVNPKYADESRASFKAPARLECMMQDFPKLLGGDAKIGYAQFEESYYSPVKNNPADAASKVASGLHGACPATGEADFYSMGCRLLSQPGVELLSFEPAAVEPVAEAEAAPMGPVITVPIAIESAAAQPFLDIPVVLGPAVVLAPAFAVTSVEAASKVNGGSVSARSTLVIEGRDVVLDNLVLDGALVVKAVPGARVTLKNLTITNSGWEFVALAPDDDAGEELAIRGYHLVRHEERVLNFTEPGTYVVSE